jgi:hypothetical protein
MGRDGHGTTIPGRATRLVGGLALAGLVLATAACSTGVPNPGTPTDAVREAFRLVDAGDLDALLAITCDAQRDAIRRQFSFSDLGSLAGLDVDLAPLFRALELDASRLTITETSVSGDRASVLVSGPLLVGFDAEQLRDTFRRLAEEQGTPVQDAQLDALIAALQASSQTVAVNETVEIAREGGAWRLCSRLTLVR